MLVSLLPWGRQIAKYGIGIHDTKVVQLHSGLVG